MIYLISYDLNKPGQNYKSLYEAMDGFTDWWHFLDSTWLVYTSLDAAGIFQRLRLHIDQNDDLLIIKVTKDHSGWLPQKAWDWINKYL